MALFKDMLKKWFYTTGTNPTLATTSRVPVLDDSGNPVGSTTLATLAGKVLNDALLGLENTAIPNTADLDDYVKTGVFRSPNANTTGGVSNKPTGLDAAFNLYVIQTTTSLSYPIQIIISYQGIWRRFKGINSWGAWKQLDA